MTQWFSSKPLNLEKNTLETSGEQVKTTLETSGEQVKTTLETSGKETAPSVSFSSSFTIGLLVWISAITLETSGEDGIASTFENGLLDNLPATE